MGLAKNRGRVQSQGTHLEESVSWDTDNVEMNQPIGYDRDTGAILTKVKIIVMKGPNKLLQETHHDKY